MHAGLGIVLAGATIAFGWYLWHKRPSLPISEEEARAALIRQAPEFSAQALVVGLGGQSVLAREARPDLPGQPPRLAFIYRSSGRVTVQVMAQGYVRQVDNTALPGGGRQLRIIGPYGARGADFIRLHDAQAEAWQAALEALR